MVRLRDLLQVRNELLTHYNFNSSMVRLRVINVCIIADGQIKFQFQYGAIEGILRLQYLCTVNTISIPVWCD